MKTLFLIPILFYCFSVYADFSDLQQEAAADIYKKESLSNWIKILEMESPEELAVKAPHAIFKIEASRAHAKLLAFTYKKAIGKSNLRYAILDTLVRAEMITILDGWQNELLSKDLTFEQRLNLNYGLELRENAVKNLYKEAQLQTSFPCKLGRKKFNLEILTDSKSDFLWMNYSGHYYYTGIKGTVAPEKAEKNTICPPVAVSKLGRDHLALFSTGDLPSVVIIETRKMRPTQVIRLSPNTQFEEVTRINERQELCFLRGRGNLKFDAKQNWYCKE